METHRQLLEIQRDTTVWLVQRDARDLTARQLAVLLICYLEGPHTVRGLAAMLGVGRPAITRVADRLVELNFVKRREGKHDRRSVLLVTTLAGRVFVQEMGARMKAAADRERSSAVEVHAIAD